MIDRERLRRVYAILHAHYGARGWWPLMPSAGTEPEYVAGRWQSDRSAAEVFEIGAGAILTQRSAWRNVVPILRALSAAGRLDPSIVAAAPSDMVEEWVRGAGPFRRKARSLIAWAAWCAERGASTLPPSYAELEPLEGFGPETIDSVLLYGFGAPRFIADAYARRVLARVGVAPPTDRYSVLARAVGDAKEWGREFCDESHALLVEVGKRHCHPRPRCDGCPLREECDTGSSADSGGVAT